MNTPSLVLPSAVALALLLTACSAGGGGDAPAPDSTTTAGAAATATDEDQPGRDGALPVRYDVEAVDFGAPAEVTAPGTSLAAGTPAWLNQTITVDGQEITGGVGVSVLGVRKLDPAIFDQFSNADEFAAYTPYAVVVQHQWLYEVPEDTTPETIDLFPLAADGSDVQYLTSGFSFNAPGDSCGLTLPEYDEENQVLVSCFVALGETERVTGAEYNGEGYSSIIASSDNAYFPAPVVWQ